MTRLNNIGTSTLTTTLHVRDWLSQASFSTTFDQLAGFTISKGGSKSTHYTFSVSGACCLLVAEHPFVRLSLNLCMALV